VAAARATQQRLTGLFHRCNWPCNWRVLAVFSSFPSRFSRLIRASNKDHLKSSQVKWSQERSAAWGLEGSARVTRCPVEWSGVEWSGVEWSGVEWSGVEWSGVAWRGVEWSGVGGLEAQPNVLTNAATHVPGSQGHAKTLHPSEHEQQPSNQVKSSHINASQHKSNHEVASPGQVKSSQVTSTQVKSSGIKSSGVKSNGVKST